MFVFFKEWCSFRGMLSDLNVIFTRGSCAQVGALNGAGMLVRAAVFWLLLVPRS